MFILTALYLLGIAALLCRAAWVQRSQTWDRDLGMAVALALWPGWFLLTALLSALLLARQAGIWPMIAFMPSLFFVRLRHKLRR
jgi:hypothetical protein